jgi:hypothetical protein
MLSAEVEHDCCQLAGSGATRARRVLRFFRHVFGHRVEGLRQNVLQHDGNSVLHVRHKMTVCIHRLRDSGLTKKVLHYLGIDPLREQQCCASAPEIVEVDVGGERFTLPSG